MARKQAIRAAAWSVALVTLGGYAAHAEPPAPGSEPRGTETARAHSNDSKRPAPKTLANESSGPKEAVIAREEKVGPVARDEKVGHKAKDEGAVLAGGAGGEEPGAEGQPKARRRSGTHMAEEMIPSASSSAARSRTTGVGGPASSPPQRVARVIPKQPCLRDPVVFERGFGGGAESLVLTQCNGSPAPQSVEQLSILARPMNAPEPSVPTILAAVPHPQDQKKEWLPGVKLLDGGLVSRLQAVVDHFRSKKLIVVSGYRPASVGSFHQSAHALDFTIEGVRNDALVAFCRTLPDTGCGYYPNSSFIHMDVRPSGTGHPYWIDASGPGEAARYVSSWPPPRSEKGQGSHASRAFSSMPCDDQDHWDLLSLGPASKRAGRVEGRSSVDAPSRGRSEEAPFHP